MTISPAPHRVASTFTHSWGVGGALLLGSVAIGLGATEATGSFGFAIAVIVVQKILLTASIVVFAVGIRADESVTARRPLGTIALLLLAVWLLVGDTLLFSDYVNPGLALILGYTNSFIQFSVALIGVVQIARAPVVPRPWNLAPAVVLATSTFTWLLLQLVSTFISAWPAGGPSAWIVVLIIFDTLASIGGLMVLGLIAIILADRASRQDTAVR
jgi:hypothetical protein